MKKIFTILIATMLSISSFTQINDSINTMPGYSHDVFYNLENSTVKSEAGDNWTIAFSTSSFSVSAYINDGRGVKLYETAYDTADFSTVDTTGMNFTSNYNDYTNWNSSAFENNGTGGTNYGWGDYNTVSHAVTGTRVYVLKAISGEFFKILIEEKAMGIWKVRYDKLDNSNLQTTTIDGTTDNDKNFVYLNIDNDMIATDREPVSADWDLLFTKFYDTDIPYAVTGFLVNNGLEIAQVDGESTTTSTYVGQNFTESVKEIGSDWKNFNMSTFSYDIVADRSYFIKKDLSTDDDEIYNYYKLVFTGFDGSSTGKVFFTTELVISDTITTTPIDTTTENPNGVNDIENLHVVSVYPNPATDFANILIDGKINTTAILTISNTIGQTIYSELKELTTGLNVIGIDVSNFESGIYFLKIQNEGKSELIKIQVK
ncbi:MAG: hypothetical protein ACI8ZX_001147 [Planctomycetota bacterium]|jgi:hypothetical protein